MTKHRRNVFFTSAALFCVAFVGVCMFRRTPLGHVFWPPRYAPSVSDAPVFATPPGFGPTGPIYLRTRCVGEEGGSTLITRGERYVDLPEVPILWPVYLYDGAKRTLTRANASEWRNAGGPIAEDGGGVTGHDFSLKFVDEVLKYRLTSGPLQDFETRGKLAVKLTASPDGRLICVLTADGA